MLPSKDCLRGVLVLLVDDHADTLEIFGSFLRHFGAHVGVEASAQAALQYLAIARPDVIVTDHSMPGMTGFELLERVRKMPGDAERPIRMILCSAVGDLDAMAKAAGFDGYMAKPVDPHALVEKIERLAGRR